METVEQKALDIHNARNYIYKHGEAAKIANMKFDRALAEGTLSQFPNVFYF